MWRSLVSRILLVLATFMSAPDRPTYWAQARSMQDVSDDEVADWIKSCPMHYAATFSEFYCASTGANVNGGSDTGSPSMSDTAGTGTWTSATNIYLSVATNGAVAVGQFMSIYSGSATVAAYTARIVTVTGGGGSIWTITLSATAFSGAVPTTGSTFKAQVGGAWLGPNAAVAFPFNYITAALKDAAGDLPRVSFFGTFTMTAAITHSLVGPVYFQGGTAAAGDLGKASISGATTGAAYIPLTISAADVYLRDFIVLNNGATSSAAGISLSSGATVLERVVVHNTLSHGIQSSTNDIELIECEIYTTNTANVATSAGVRSTGRMTCIDTISHHNTTSNTSGFYCTTAAFYSGCTADGNGAFGYSIPSTAATLSQVFLYCNAYANVSDGCRIVASAMMINFKNCNFVSNGTSGTVYGLNSTSTSMVRTINCGYFGNFTAATAGAIDDSGTITYAASPFIAPTTGNFGLLPGSGGKGIAKTFTTSYSGYTTPSTTYNDVGMVQGTDVATGMAGAY